LNLNSLVSELVSAYPIIDYDSDDPDKGYIDEKYTVATDLVGEYFDKFNQTSADSLDNELDCLTSLVFVFPGHPKAREEIYYRF